MWGRLTLIALGAKPGKLPKPVEITHPGRTAFQPAATRTVTRNLADLARFVART